MPPKEALVAGLSEIGAPIFRWYSWAKLIIPNVSETRQSSWPGSSVFVLEKWSKYLNFQSFFLPLIDPLVATVNETRAPTSRKYVSEQAIVIPNWSKTFQTFWLQSSVFPLEKQPKNLNFQSFLPLIDPLVATFSETCAPTSRKYVAEKGLMMPNLWQTRQSFWLHSSFFLLERYPKNLNFQSFYTTKTSFDGDFQWE